jgi:hypothetical protein
VNRVPTILGFVIGAWFFYLAIEVARHVNAWPF